MLREKATIFFDYNQTVERKNRRFEICAFTCKYCLSDLGTYRNCSNSGSNFAVVCSLIYTCLLKSALLDIWDALLYFVDIPKYQGNTEYTVESKAPSVLVHTNSSTFLYQKI